MRRLIRWSSLALQDLREIREYIQRNNVPAAKSEAQKIRKSTERLSRFSESGRKVQVIPMVRELIAGNYRIFYRLFSSEVRILRVYHGKRNIHIA